MSLMNREPGLTAIGQIPGTAESLTFTVLDACVEVRHEERADVAVFANRPEHWLVADGIIRQTAVRLVASDVRIVIKVNSFDLGKSVGEFFVRLVRRLSGKPAVSEESTTPPPSVPEPRQQLGPDRLLVLVPANYTGSLKSSVSGSGEMSLDSWRGSDFVLDYNSDGDLDVGPVSIEGRFKLDQSSDADVTLGDINAGDIAASFSGDYGVTISAINAAGHFELSRYGDGSLTTGDIRAGSSKYDLNGDGTTELGNIIGEGDIKIVQRDDTTVEMKDISGGTVDIDLSGDYGFTAGVITAGVTARVERYGDGELTIKGITAPRLKANLYGDGSHDLGDLQVPDITISHDNGDNDLRLGVVQSQYFTLEHSSDGSVTVGRLDTTSINLNCYGCGDVDVRSGSAQSGRVYNGGDLNLCLTGRFGFISQKNDGDGSVEVKIIE
ncbi:MAG: hypothetical protein JSS83_10785 [Cyanobacteria bacterium SZAS LIN-3]|nr:hypothetical protein [Cyanobacteria bacterium SZAS LIN-3]MBS2006053.1 hypothetical protein [Cyanobacteria bacterium SZAS TMP-1]